MMRRKDSLKLESLVDNRCSWWGSCAEKRCCVHDHASGGWHSSLPIEFPIFVDKDVQILVHEYCWIPCIKFFRSIILGEDKQGHR
jgi:hypothetical protein